MTTEYLVLSALGSDRPGIVNQLAKVASTNGCNIEDSRMTVLGGEFTMLMLLSGSDQAITELERSVPGVGNELGLMLLSKRTRPRPPQPAARPYRIEVTALDQPGLVHELANFFSGRHINIESLDTDTYSAPHTGSQMFGLQMIVNIPSGIQVSALREEFLEHCDTHNLDASFDPIRL